ncbi:MAG: DUF3326 domain-containing protein [Alphaproteobacteria bacterium]
MELALGGIETLSFRQIEEALGSELNETESILRWVISRSDRTSVKVEYLVLGGYADELPGRRPCSSGLCVRPFDDASSFNCALVIPTGAGAEIGGHAGDAGPVVRLMSQLCDTVITHPNTVNASDINEQPENCLYVEGSVLSRFMQGLVGLQQARRNRVLVVVDAHKDELFSNAAVNSVNAARATYGLDCAEVALLEPGVRLRAKYGRSGRAVGDIENLDYLVQLLRKRQSEFDAVAISSVIDVPPQFHFDYFASEGRMVNPWGGVEAMLTHAISTLTDIPSAHCPMFEAQQIANADPGIVDPRMAAEAVSLTFIQCILKGLQRSPRIVPTPPLGQSHLMDVTNVSCLVIPDGCLGIPTLAALNQGIPVVAVRENKNLMQNNLSLLPWASGQFYLAENYWEAAGIVASLKAGIAPGSVRRPLLPVRTSVFREREFFNESAHTEEVT